MLNLLSDYGTAAEARALFVPGALLPSAVQTEQPCKGAVVFARPRATRAAAAFGQRRSAFADLGTMLGQRNPGKQYPHPTRIAASGGAEGPHPAREPV